MSEPTAPRGRAADLSAADLVPVRTMTYAQAAVLALDRALGRDQHVVVLGEDVGRGGIFGQYTGLQQRYGELRVIDTPISEATIVGAGVGMALAGARPVVEMRVVDFALCAIDEIVNQAAKNRFMFGGQGRVPLVLRMPIGIWSASAAQHSQSLEAWFAHIPGLTVVCPATPQDNYALLSAALAGEDPVAYLEHKELWSTSGEVDEHAAAPLGRARIDSAGSDLTIVTWSRQLLAVRDAAAALATHAISTEVIDLRTIWPWDREAVLASCAKTRRLLVVHEAVQAAGFGAEIVASAAEHFGADRGVTQSVSRVVRPPLRVARLAAPRIPVGYAPNLEAVSRIGADAIVAAARALLAD